MNNLYEVVGAWRLISWKTVYDHGRVIFPMGEDAKGYLVYSGDGFMSASLFMAKREHLKSGEMLTADDKEKIKAWNSYFSYSGKYVIEENKIHHYVLSSMYPNWVGEKQTRIASLDSGKLTLETLPQKTKKGVQRSIVEWVKNQD
tara:strand:- start:12 stop:446 length:435 start_codon:yes stop_codon:yes gene_type:complete